MTSTPRVGFVLCYDRRERWVYALHFILLQDFRTIISQLLFSDIFGTSGFLLSHIPRSSSTRLDEVVSAIDLSEEHATKQGILLQSFPTVGLTYGILAHDHFIK